jgi:hypothetical protein
MTAIKGEGSDKKYRRNRMLWLGSNYSNGGGIMAIVAIITSRTKRVISPSIVFLFSILTISPQRE